MPQPAPSGPCPGHRVSTRPVPTAGGHPGAPGRAAATIAVLLGLAACLPAVSGDEAPRPGAVIVAAHDAPPAVSRWADLQCDGVDDARIIMQAIAALPETGGTVRLLAGNYHIRRVDGSLGGITIDRSHVTLAGQGEATLLRLADGQNTNVIRIIGSGVGHVTIRDLSIDANRQGNDQGRGDPDVAHDRFEFCGIKAFRQRPGGPPAAEDCHHITVRDCSIRNAHRLGVMLEGPNMAVLDNRLGDAGSDSVEILTGPGLIRGNIVDVRGRTHVAIGSDRADDIVMALNVVRVHAGGHLDIAFRSWAGSARHVIQGNVLTVLPGGHCGVAIDARGTDTALTGNTLRGSSGTELRIGGGDTVLSGNVLRDLRVVVDDRAPDSGPVVFGANAARDCRLEIRRGRVVGTLTDIPDPAVAAPAAREDRPDAPPTDRQPGSSSESCEGDRSSFRSSSRRTSASSMIHAAGYS